MALNTHSIAHVSIIDSSGDISKNDLLVHTRSSRFWKGFIGSKNKPCSPASKVEFFPDRSSQTELAFKLLDMNKDGFITKEEFIKVSKTLDSAQIEAVFERFDLNKDGRLSLGEFRKLMEKH